MNNKKEIENCLDSKLTNMLSDFDSGLLTTESILCYFSQILLDANVDSKIIVNVLEKFEEYGKEIALGIKINEGW